MPTGYASEGLRYSKKQGRWLKKEKEKAIDYDTIDKKSWALLVSFFRFYPDYFYDLIRSPNAPYKLELPQRLMMRAFARYQNVYITGARGIVKTLTTLLSRLHDGVFYPSTEARYYAPSQKQSAALASQAFAVAESCYPLMTSWWRKKNDRDAMFKVVTDYNSAFSMYAPRGDNFAVCVGEEMAQEGGADDCFPFDKFESDVKKGHRIVRKINGKVDRTRVQLKFHCISNAASRINPAFTVYRKAALNAMLYGEKYDGFCMDISWISALLCNLRDIAYYKKEKATSTQEVWLREMCVRYTGTGENPMIPDEILARSRKMLTMETEHCGQPDVIYIVAHDDSTVDKRKNAKCADIVWKLTKYRTTIKRDKYLAQMVFIDGYAPPETAYLRAKRLKELWQKFCLANGETTYLVVDTRNAGADVVGELMKPMDDGLPALCCIDGFNKTVEQPKALRCIWAMQASRGGANDENSIINYSRTEYEQGNIEILTSDIRKGVEAYKTKRGIKDDTQDGKIAAVYRRVDEYCQQVQNLEVVPSGSGVKEKRKSMAIQRDYWSGSKYGLWVKKWLEDKLKTENYRPKSSYAVAAEEYMKNGIAGHLPQQANDTRSKLLAMRKR